MIGEKKACEKFELVEIYSKMVVASSSLLIPLFL
jgi:hypothetical protein